MLQILWSKRSRDDLASIAQYIADDNPLAAKRLVDMILDRVELLMHHPRMGRVVPERSQENIRELIVNRYRIVYLLDDGDASVVVLTVFEGHALIKLDPY